MFVELRGLFRLSKRFNLEYGRKTPRLSASVRTWSRWRMFKNISTQEDQKRESMIQESRDTFSKLTKLPHPLQALLGNMK